VAGGAAAGFAVGFLGDAILQGVQIHRGQQSSFNLGSAVISGAFGALGGGAGGLGSTIVRNVLKQGAKRTLAEAGVGAVTSAGAGQAGAETKKQALGVGPGATLKGAAVDGVAGGVGAGFGNFFAWARTRPGSTLGSKVQKLHDTELISRGLGQSEAAAWARGQSELVAGAVDRQTLLIGATSSGFFSTATNVVDQPAAPAAPTQSFLGQLRDQHGWSLSVTSGVQVKVGSQTFEGSQPNQAVGVPNDPMKDQGVTSSSAGIGLSF
jgi:hypothetical protein